LKFKGLALSRTIGTMIEISESKIRNKRPITKNWNENKFPEETAGVSPHSNGESNPLTYSLFRTTQNIKMNETKTKLKLTE
jgi:hypothetical protein